MKFSHAVSIGTTAIIAAFVLVPASLSATSLPAVDLSTIGAYSSMTTEVKCVKVEGKLKCGKHVSKNDDDGGHKHKNKDSDNDDGTKTVKLIKEQDTCQVFTQGKGAMGCGGSSGFRTSRCDKLNDGDTVCCCYHADDSQ